jgi:hypothetical protein
MGDIVSYYRCSIPRVLLVSGACAGMATMPIWRPTSLLVALAGVGMGLLALLGFLQGVSMRVSIADGLLRRDSWLRRKSLPINKSSVATVRNLGIMLAVPILVVRTGKKELGVGLGMFSPSDREAMLDELRGEQMRLAEEHLERPS